MQPAEVIKVADNDGIYNTDVNTSTAYNDEVTDEERGNYYKQYFGAKAAQLDDIPEENLVFTDIESIPMTPLMIKDTSLLKNLPQMKIMEVGDPMVVILQSMSTMAVGQADGMAAGRRLVPPMECLGLGQPVLGLGQSSLGLGRLWLELGLGRLWLELGLGYCGSNHLWNWNPIITDITDMDIMDMPIFQ